MILRNRNLMEMMSFIYLFIYLFILFVVDFVIHLNETAMGLHVLPIPKDRDDVI